MEKERGFDIDGLVKVVKEVLAGADGDRALQYLRGQLEVLNTRIPRKAFGAVRADIFPLTYELVRQALKLADEFRKRDDLKREEMALYLRSQAVCKTYGHHRHLVGPAMIELADCRRRMGRPDAAQWVYDAVIKDFAVLLEWGGTDEQARIGLQSLKTALEHTEGASEDLLARTRTALEKCRSKPLD